MSGGWKLPDTLSLAFDFQPGYGFLEISAKHEFPCREN